MQIEYINSLLTSLFQLKWKDFHDDGFSDPELKYPGVYLLSCTDKKLKGRAINENQILYVGMSNAAGGVRTRLKQFRDGINKYGFHSGAMRFYREYQNNKPFSKLRNAKRFYYVALSVTCVSEKSKLTAADLRELGHVSCLEYYAIARIREKTGQMPPLNKFGKRMVPRVN